MWVSIVKALAFFIVRPGLVPLIPAKSGQSNTATPSVQTSPSRSRTSRHPLFRNAVAVLTAAFFDYLPSRPYCAFICIDLAIRYQLFTLAKVL
ncbi:hypothetical protein FA15DRAFT_224774 [Coprinopsis marcescibilis]|uniref:Secreted protein n=1 Tax=Coprinopsis marcescibilis TaxID=230819 RepID=A0A5C3KGS8_COPMA|nr:hypothetical protein FA15DRAFT_224774 [Coprinopsis marcescibilis]